MRASGGSFGVGFVKENARGKFSSSWERKGANPQATPPQFLPVKQASRDERDLRKLKKMGQTGNPADSEPASELLLHFTSCMDSFTELLRLAALQLPQRNKVDRIQVTRSGGCLHTEQSKGAKVCKYPRVFITFTVSTRPCAGAFISNNLWGLTLQLLHMSSSEAGFLEVATCTRKTVTSLLYCLSDLKLPAEAQATLQSSKQSAG